MKKICEFLMTEEDGPVVVGHLALEGGEISAHPKEGNEELLQRVLDNPIMAEQGTKMVTAKDDPERWFNGLPVAYSGSYFRARMK